jgi:tryptophan halogenase
MLMHHIINYNEENIKKYNDDYENIIENVRDFIVLHYLVNKKDSPFWKNLKLKIPNSLKNKLNIWKDRLPQRDDFRGSYNLFYEANWSIILKELGLVNKKSITKEFKMLNDNLQRHTKKVTEENINMLKTSSNWIDHKNYLEALARAR